MSKDRKTLAYGNAHDFDAIVDQDGDIMDDPNCIYTCPLCDEQFCGTDDLCRHIGHDHKLYAITDPRRIERDSSMQCPLCDVAIHNRHSDWLLGFLYLIHAIVVDQLEEHILALEMMHGTLVRDQESEDKS